MDKSTHYKVKDDGTQKENGQGKEADQKTSEVTSPLKRRKARLTGAY
jgi:hypothetical protein